MHLCSICAGAGTAALFSQLGVKNLILTNAAGGISENYYPGDIISITDHINLTGNNPLMGKNFDTFGPRFPDMSEVYDKNFINLAKYFHQCCIFTSLLACILGLLE